MRMKNWKALLTALMLVLILAVAVGGTIAWIIDETEPVKNTFAPAGVPSEVEEVIEGDTKKSVAVKNNGNIPAFIRVAVVANWCDEEGKIIQPYSVPESSIIKSNGWFKVGNYYYYNAAVAPNGTTKNLLENFVEPAEKPADTHLELTIACQSIQSVPDSTVESVWPVDASNGTLTAKSGS